MSCFENMRTAGDFALYPHRPAGNGAKVEGKDIGHAGIVLEYLKARTIYFIYDILYLMDLSRKKFAVFLCHRFYGT
jgi:hypothetical protein